MEFKQRPCFKATETILMLSQVFNQELEDLKTPEFDSCPVQILQVGLTYPLNGISPTYDLRLSMPADTNNSTIRLFLEMKITELKIQLMGNEIRVSPQISLEIPGGQMYVVLRVTKLAPNSCLWHSLCTSWPFSISIRIPDISIWFVKVSTFPTYRRHCTCGVDSTRNKGR